MICVHLEKHVILFLYLLIKEDRKTFPLMQDNLECFLSWKARYAFRKTVPLLWGGTDVNYASRGSRQQEVHSRQQASYSMQVASSKQHAVDIAESRKYKISRQMIAASMYLRRQQLAESSEKAAGNRLHAGGRRRQISATLATSRLHIDGTR